MKFYLFLFGLAASGVLGFLCEKNIRPHIVLPSGHPSTAPLSSTRTPNKPIVLTADQLPKTVTLKSEVKTADPESGITMTIAAGTRVNLLKIEGQMAIISPEKTHIQLELPIHECDLLDQLTANPPQNSTSNTATEPAPEPAPKTENASEQAPTTEPAPETENAFETEPAPATESAPETENAFETEPAPATEPAPETENAFETEPAPATEPAPETESAFETPSTTEAAPPAKTDVVSVMQASVRSGQIKEFTMSQVLSWKAGVDETVEGTVIQTGTATYKAETIFGVKTIQAKALIQNAKVLRWEHSKSGLEIK